MSLAGLQEIAQRAESAWNDARFGAFSDTGPADAMVSAAFTPEVLVALLAELQAGREYADAGQAEVALESPRRETWEHLYYTSEQAHADARVRVDECLAREEAE